MVMRKTGAKNPPPRTLPIREGYNPPPRFVQPPPPPPAPPPPKKK